MHIKKNNDEQSYFVYVQYWLCAVLIMYSTDYVHNVHPLSITHGSYQFMNFDTSVNAYKSDCEFDKRYLQNQASHLSLA